MEKPSPTLIKLIGEIDVPDPNADETITFTPQQLSSLTVVIALLANYIDVQLKRCSNVR